MAKLIHKGRDLALIFCGALGAYLISLVVMARLGILVLGAARGSDSTWLKLALGMVALDLGKVPGLLLVGWAMARATRLAPWGNALGLVLLVYVFDVAVSVLLQQAGWLWAEPAVLACRVAAAAGMVALLAWLTRWLRRRTRSGRKTDATT